MPVELIVEAATKLGIEAVKKFFEGKKDEKDLISIGLAVGYFYNFLNVISGVRMSSGKQRRASSFLRRNKAGCTESTTISSSVVTNRE